MNPVLAELLCAAEVARHHADGLRLNHEQIERDVVEWNPVDPSNGLCGNHLALKAEPVVKTLRHRVEHNSVRRNGASDDLAALNTLPRQTRHQLTVVGRNELPAPAVIPANIVKTSPVSDPRYVTTINTSKRSLSLLLELVVKPPGHSRSTTANHDGPTRTIGDDQNDNAKHRRTNNEA